MNLTPEELAELNALLADKKIDIPDFRREVGTTGLNFHWLKKHILVRNKQLVPRLRELLKV